MINKINLKKAVKITISVLAIVLLLYFLQIPQAIRCEILTAKYGHIFEDPKVYKTCSGIGDNFDLKVLEYSPQHTLVYYVGKYIDEDGDEFNDGTVVRYRVNYGGNWVCMSENTVWSETGSAEGTVMPYWWHWFIY